MGIQSFLPVGSSPKRIQGIGLNPVVCENVNRMSETRDPQFHFMWMQMAKEAIVRQQKAVDTKRSPRRQTVFMRIMPEEQPINWTMPMMIVA